MPSELARRVLASVILAPLAVIAAWFGDWALAGLLSITGALSAWEFYRIARAGGVAPLDRLGVPMAAVLPLLVHAAYLRVFALSLGAAAVAFLVIFSAAVWARGPSGRPLSAVSATVTGVIYTGGLLSFAYALRYHPYTFERAAGTAVLGFPLLLTWTTDVGAYFVGRSIGRRKLIPSVSPGKSVEGAIGGLLLALLVAWAYERWVLVPYAHFRFMPGAVFLFAAVVSIASMLGDLAESLIKREAGVKDASSIIPGHGGILDRVDSLLFALPTAYWLLGILRLVPVMA
ncbi:MAG TPA: phosphatidate cytidylyltransferase [Gemmatimonadaceae bacterium]|nr:phosphatidate cytidylyltransferase [Gemmatimonadaceae bacterium]